MDRIDTIRTRLPRVGHMAPELFSSMKPPILLIRACSVFVVCLILALAGTSSAAASGTALFPQSVASGDPTPSSVVLWTRLVDPALPTNAPDPMLSLEVAADGGFTNIVFSRTNLLARRAFDFCVKTKATGLAPRTRYYYRFVYGGQSSAIGRTQTAPAPNDPVPVRFSYICCQDYIGRYYNTLADLVNREADNLDFVVHLGDYIYETVNEGSFQNTNSYRQIQFRDLAGAKVLGTVTSPVFAASSLDNYRQLYETYHSDPTLQALHEKVPMINIWDDHEYADDCYGANSTDSNGLLNESDPTRRQHGEQAFFEFIPIDQGYDDQGVSIDSSMLFPNARIYRNLSFGSLVDLFLTDYRSYRPAPLIPADAFPATIVMPENVVSNLVGPTWVAARSGFDPYVNIDAAAYFLLKTELVAGAASLFSDAGLDKNAAAARAAQVIKGNLSVTVINQALAEFGVPTPFTSNVIASLPRGLSYAFLGKTDFFSSLGSRYLVVRDTFRLVAAWKALTDPNSQNVYGDAQFAQLATAVNSSLAPWKIATSSVSLCPLGFDFANPPVPLPTNLPNQLRIALQLNAEDLDGFPNMRNSLLDLYGTNNAVVISGDIHASFVTTYASAGGHKVPEFTGPAVSSQSIQEGVVSTVKGNATLAAIQGVDQLLAATGIFFEDYIGKSGIATPVGLDTSSHGYVVMDATADRLLVDYRLISNSEITNDYTAPSMAQTLASKMSTTRYAVTKGSAGLFTRLVPGMLVSRAAGGDLVIQWPSSAADCTLQSSDAAPATAVWSDVSATATPVPGTNLLQVELPAAGSAKFYRLFCPTP